MKNVLGICLSLCLMAFSCSKPPSRFNPSKTRGVEVDPHALDPATSVGSEDLSLGLVALPGSQIRFLDAFGLNVYYKNVFLNATYGYEHCKQGRPLDASDCTRSIFTVAERPLMGTFEIALPNTGRRRPNVENFENMTLNYMRTLRAALSRECNALVDRETARLLANATADNVLIKAAAPSSADLEEFFRSLLGVRGSGMLVDAQAPAYVESFNAVIAAAPAAEKAQAQRQAYLGLCIALSMSPQIIMY